MKYRSDIDGLRAIAVAPVVLYHASIPGFSGGFAGVDVFFVISGYLITRIIHDEITEKQFSVVSFYERRARRILPALFAVIAASFAVGWFVLPPREYTDLVISAASSLAFISNLWFWQNSGGYFDSATDYLPLLHTWSLAVEEQFYILFPWLLIFAARIGRGMTQATIWTLIVTSFGLAVWATQTMPSASFYLLPTRIWELCIGSLLAVSLRETRLPRSLREIIAGAGLIAIGGTVFFLDASTPFPGIAAVPPVIGTAAIIWAGASGSSVTSKVLSWRPIVFAGLISYSLYLWHWPIFSFIRNRNLSVEMSTNETLIAISASIAIACISWRFIERPFRKPVRLGGWSRPQIFAGAIMGAGALSAVCLTVIATNGASIRFVPEELRMLNGLERDSRIASCGGARAFDSLCTFGAADSNSHPRWILWGDSHAESILPAISKLAERQNVELLYANQAACAPLPNLTRSDHTAAKRKKCVDFNTSIMSQLAASEHIDTVVLHARWALYVEGYSASDNAQNLILLSNALNGNERDADTMSERELVVASLSDLVSSLIRKDKRVVLIGPVPEISWNVADEVKRSVLFGGTLPSAPSYDQTRSRLFEAELVLEEVASATGANYISLSDGLCSEYCPVHDSAGAYYRDSHHLTTHGAVVWVSPIIEEAMKP